MAGIPNKAVREQGIYQDVPNKRPIAAAGGIAFPDPEGYSVIGTDSDGHDICLAYFTVPIGNTATQVVDIDLPSTEMLTISWGIAGGFYDQTISKIYAEPTKITITKTSAGAWAGVDLKITILFRR